jgi:hypothetical protein
VGRSLALSALVIVAMTSAAPCGARAQSGSSAIVWEAEPGLECMEGAQLVREVDARLRQPRLVDLELSVRGRAERTENGGARAVLVLYAGEVEIGERTVETDASCRELDHALPIVIAMMLNVRREDLAIFLPRRRQTTPVREVAPSGVVEALPPPRATRAGNETSATAVAIAGTLPDVAIGVRVGASAVIESRSVIGLDVVVAPESVRGIALGRVAFRMVSVGLTSCALGGPVTQWLRLEVCAGVRLDALWAEPTGFDEAHPALEWLVELEVGGRAELALDGPLWATAGAAGTVPIPQPGFGYQAAGGGISEIHRVSPITGRLDLGLAVRFE